MKVKPVLASFNERNISARWRGRIRPNKESPTSKNTSPKEAHPSQQRTLLYVVKSHEKKKKFQLSPENIRAMILPRPTFRWCIRISISVHMFVHLLHDFSLEPFLYYFAFSLIYDTLDHSFFGGPDAWYMARDSLISLVWILTLHLGAGEFLFTIQALILTTCI
jgi:hypothetical protein